VVLMLDVGYVRYSTLPVLPSRRCSSPLSYSGQGGGRYGASIDTSVRFPHCWTVRRAGVFGGMGD